jgi:hypothetical protein
MNLLARIVGDAVGRIHEAQCRGRDDGLFERLVRELLRDVAIRIGEPPVAKRAGGEPRHPRRVTAGERDLETVRCGVRQIVHRVRPEVVVLALLAVGDDRRAGRLESRDRVTDRRLVHRIESRIIGVAVGHRLDELQRARNASDRLRRDDQHGEILPFLTALSRRVVREVGKSACKTGSAASVLA